MKISHTDFKELDDILLKNKPHVANSTRKTYSSILRNLFTRMYGLGVDFKPDCFSDSKAILEELKDAEPKKRKTILSAIIAFNGEKYKSKEISEAMLNDIHEAKNSETKQVKNEKQEDNWISFEEIENIFEKKYNSVKPLLKRTDIDNTEYFRITELIILALTTGIFFPPRRSLDWVSLKIKNYDDEKDNYIDMKKKMIVLNNYKTSKYYKMQTIPIPTKLWVILKPYILINNFSDYLLTTRTGDKLSTPRLTQILNKLFKKNVSTSMLRHIYLTHKLGHIPKLDELNELAKEMGHSLLQQQEYILHDPEKP